MIVNAGIINHADPIRNLYKIDPALGRSNERVSVIYATALGVGSITSKATHIPTYQVGDCVIYVIDNGQDNIKITPWAVIIGTYPGAVETNIEDINKIVTKRFTSFYDSVTKLLGYTDDFNKKGFAHNWSIVDRGNDYQIDSYGISFNISDYDAHFRTKHAGIYLNGVTHELNTFGFTSNSDFINRTDRTYIINNVPYEHRCYLSNLLNKPTDKTVIRYEQQSPFIGGHKTTTLVKGVPVSTTEDTDTGIVHFKNINGFIFDKDINIPLLLPKYETNIITDNDLKSDGNLFKEKQLPNTWEYINANTNKRDLWDPNELDNSFSGYPTKKLENIPYTESKARIGALPDGSIILRDAWGSEIRMKDGDIQISAANKITLLGATDILNICGGVYTTNAVKGIQLGSSEGKVEARADECIISSKTKNTIHSEGSLHILSNSDVDILGKTLTIDANYILQEARYDSIIKANNINVLGENRATVGTNKCITDYLSGTICLAADHFSIYSSVSIDKGSYDSGELLIGDKIKKNGSDRSLKLNGFMVVDGNLHVNKNITSSELVAANQVAAKNTGLGGTIYGLRHKPKKADADKNDVKVKSTANKFFTGKIKLLDLDLFSSDRIKRAIDKLLTNLYTVTKNNIAIFKPIFAQSTDRKAFKPSTVDISNKERYIYPGEFFWKSSGLKIQYPVDVEDLSIQVTTSYSGASDLRLYK